MSNIYIICPIYISDVRYPCPSPSPLALTLALALALSLTLIQSQVLYIGRQI